MSPDLTVLLLSSFADALDKQDVQDVNSLIVTAKLAGRAWTTGSRKKVLARGESESTKGNIRC